MSEDTAGPDTCSNVITHCSCKIKNKLYDVILTNVELKWHISGMELKGLQTVRVVDILSVSLKKSTGGNTDDLCVTYVRQGKKLVLQSCSVTLTSDDSHIISNLHQQTSALVEKNIQRPRRLLVLINPVSGKSKGRSAYEQKVAPVFNEAGIDTDVIVTEKAHHTEEILSTYDIKSVDGLVLVGGDGMYHEGVNGLMRRLAMEQNVCVDNPDETLPVIDLPIGLIPCGSGNGIAKAYYGNYDVTTAALAIAVGHRAPANMMSVHNKGKFVAYSIFMVGYGIWSDLIYRAESRRSQGRLRYPITILEQMILKTFRRMPLTVQYETNEVETQQNNVGVCSNDIDNVSEVGNVTEDNTKEKAADFHVRNQSSKSATITETAISSVIFMLPAAPEYTPTAQPDLSKETMFLNKSSQWTKYISFMFRLMSNDLAALEARDDICVLTGQQWKLKLNETSESGTQNYVYEHCLNIDGEVFELPVPEYQVKLLTDKLKLFTNMPYATRRLPDKT